jgi:hypothetical protein
MSMNRPRFLVFTGVCLARKRVAFLVPLLTMLAGDLALGLAAVAPVV